MQIDLNLNVQLAFNSETLEAIRDFINSVKSENAPNTSTPDSTSNAPAETPKIRERKPRKGETPTGPAPVPPVEESTGTETPFPDSLEEVTPALSDNDKLQIAEQTPTPKYEPVTQENIDKAPQVKTLQAVPAGPMADRSKTLQTFVAIVSKVKDEPAMYEKLKGIVSDHLPEGSAVKASAIADDKLDSFAAALDTFEKSLPKSESIL